MLWAPDNGVCFIRLDLMIFAVYFMPETGPGSSGMRMATAEGGKFTRRGFSAGLTDIDEADYFPSVHLIAFRN